MSARSTCRRSAAICAALLLLVAVPFSVPASANPSTIDLGVVLDSPTLFAGINSPEPTTDPDVTFEVLDANDGTVVAQDTEPASSGLSWVSLEVPDGSYRIRATAQGYEESWFTALSGAEAGDAVFTQLLGYQERHSIADADVIVVDTAVPANSSWVTGGMTVLHRSTSSISGAVGNDMAVSQGSLLEGVTVQLYDDAAGTEALPVTTTTTDSNGYYAFNGLASGTYLVRFEKSAAARWYPETSHRAEAEAITLNGANHYNLAYAVFPAAQAGPDGEHYVSISGQPALGATLTAIPGFPVEPSPAGGNCLQRYSWFIDNVQVDGAFGESFVVPSDAGGKAVHARLNTAGLGCTYRELNSNVIGPIDPALALPGENVLVMPKDNTGKTDVSLTFANVTTAGTTTVTRLESGDGYPAGSFSALGDPPLYYDISTTAEFDPVLGAEVCIRFNITGMTEEQVAEQRLYHFVDGAWADITTSSSNGTVCGVTYSFSPFAVGTPHWPFAGFLQPVDNDGVLNVMKAGAAVPVKFGVGGNRGLAILAGAPTSTAMACPGGATPSTVEQTVAAETSSLSYSAGSDTYTFVWKTQKTWAGTCRQFELRLMDGTLHTALFDFRR